jgi:hypothetical protein
VKNNSQPSEATEQILLFAWSNLNLKKYPELELMFAVNNGLKLTIGQAVQCKRSGTVKGIPDIFLPCVRGSYAGLFIEMKRSGGRVSPDQAIKITKLTIAGYLCRVCYGFTEAKKTIEEYLKK